MPYSVRIRPTTIKQIDDFRNWFSKKRNAPETADQWVDHVIDAMLTLRYHPFRYEIAPESRRLIIGDYLALFTINERTKTVHVIGFRLGHQSPRGKQLPKELPV